MDELESNLLGLLRGEHSSLSISFNDHAANYCTVAEAIERGMYDHADWVSEDEKTKAISTGKVWEVHWYPDTPVGFYAVLASTLPAAIAAAMAKHE